MDLAGKLVDARKKKKFTQSQLAQELQVTRQTVLRWEHGTALPSTDNLRRLSQLYGVSLDYFLDEKSEDDVSVVQALRNKDGCENSSQKGEESLPVSDNEVEKPSSKTHRCSRCTMAMAAIFLLLLCMAFAIILHHSFARNTKNTMYYSDMEDASKETSSGANFNLEW